MKKRIPSWLHKLLLAVYFVAGGTFTFELSVDRVRENDYLYAVCAVLAVVFDFLFFKKLFFLMRRNEIPNVLGGLGKLFAATFRRVARLVERVNDAVHKEKNLVEGKSERTFVFETHSSDAARHRRKLPRLKGNASRRERIRHEYAVYVFHRDKNIPSSLTPNEVAYRLDESGEDRMLFERYNDARYNWEDADEDGEASE